MRRRRMRRLYATTLMLVLLALACATATPAPAADGITRGTIYKDGPDNRYLLGGDWLFRLDNEPGHRAALPAPDVDRGLGEDVRAQRLERHATTPSRR